jgi:DNA-binding transcriptional ArsR family regulator
MDSKPKTHHSVAAKQGEPLSAESVEMVAAMLKVLGDPTRIRLIELLNERGSATVSSLAACLPVCHAGVSKQLNMLHDAGVVSRRREGVWVRYELADFTGLWLVHHLASALDPPPKAAS